MKYKVIRADLKDTNYDFIIKNREISLDGQNVGIYDKILNNEEAKEKLDQLIEQNYCLGIFTIEKDGELIDIENFKNGKVLEISKYSYWDGTYSFILSRKDEEMFLEINPD